jgi:hypothetical protein
MGIHDTANASSAVFHQELIIGFSLLELLALEFIHRDNFARGSITKI